MTAIVLGPLFDRPLHPGSWRRPKAPTPGWDHYRVTNPFTGPDLINGGIHGAVDMGDGLGKPAPILSPADCRARGLSHFDGALGAELVLSPRVRILLWHLSATIERGTWTTLRRGERFGSTGNTGRQPMPYHTHGELLIDGIRRDLEPHLFGAPLDLDPGEDDDMQIPRGGQSLVFATLPAGLRLREDPSSTVGSIVTEGGERVQVVWWANRPDAPWTLPTSKGTGWYIVGHEGRTWYLADALLPEAFLTPVVGQKAVSVPAADCSAQENRIRAARTALQGAAQAHTAEGSAISAAQKALG